MTPYLILGTATLFALAFAYLAFTRTQRRYAEAKADLRASVTRWRQQ